MSVIDVVKITNYLEEFRVCMSKDYGKRTDRKNYFPLIGDPCYNYSRLAKEEFFRCPHLSFIFLFFIPHSHKEKRGKTYKEVIKVLTDEAKAALKSSERSDLLKFLK